MSEAPSGTGETGMSETERNSESLEAQGSEVQGPRGAIAIIESMRISHWIKNAFVIVPILFAKRYDQWRYWWPCLVAAGAFCLLSSGVYLINDVFDRKGDRAHPLKRRRPVASGRLSPVAATAAGFALLAGGMALAYWFSLGRRDPSLHPVAFWLFAWAGLYVVLNLAYSAWLKNRVIVDVLVVALGFVLRAMAGASAIEAPISPWLVLCTFTLCLFIAVAKRRSELIDLTADEAAAARPVSRGYRTEDLDHMLTVSAAMAILTYSLYCLAPGTVERIGSAHMIWTVPLVVYGMFRFAILTRRTGRGDPVSLLLRDLPTWIVIVLYVALTLVVFLYGPGHSELFL